MQQIIGRCARVYQERGLEPDFSIREKSSVRKLYPRRLLGKNWFCERHGLQAVTECFKDQEGYIMQLECGCDRRKDIEAAVPVKKTVASIGALPAAASLPFRDGTAMPEKRGTAA
jgi:hypothetical protein